MQLFGAIGKPEDHPDYRFLEAKNYSRYYEFLEDLIPIAVQDKHRLSHNLVQAINFHTIAGLHKDAGDYRQGPVWVGGRECPNYTLVLQMMEDSINRINGQWESGGLLEVAAEVLWRVNFIHPFSNGNGRTARALCYYTICTRSGSQLPGTPFPHVLATQRYGEYVDCLLDAYNGDSAPLVALLNSVLTQQLTS